LIIQMDLMEMEISMIGKTLIFLFLKTHILNGQKKSNYSSFHLVRKTPAMKKINANATTNPEK